MTVTVPDFDALWNFDDPAATETQFRALEKDAGTWDLDKRVELQTQLARTFSLRRQFDEAHRLLDAAEQALGKDQETRALVRIYLERGRCFNSAKEKERALPIFKAAWELALTLHEDALAVDAAHMVAIAATPDEAVAWNQKALELASRSADPKAQKWTGSLQNNLGWAFMEKKDYPRALDYFERNVAWHTARQSGEPLSIARWCVARAQRSLGRLDQALAGQLALLADRKAQGAPEDGYVSEEIAECYEAQGKHADAKPYFARAYALLSKDEWLPKDEPGRLARLKRLAE